MSNDFESLAKTFDAAAGAADKDLSGINRLLQEIGELSAQSFVGAPPSYVPQMFAPGGTVTKSVPGNVSGLRDFGENTGLPQNMAPTMTTSKPGSMFEGEIGEAWTAWVDDAWRKLQKGEQLLHAEVEGTVDWCIQQASDMRAIRSKRDVRRMVEQYFTSTNATASPIPTTPPPTTTTDELGFAPTETRSRGARRYGHVDNFDPESLGEGGLSRRARAAIERERNKQEPVDAEAIPRPAPDLPTDESQKKPTWFQSLLTGLAGGQQKSDERIRDVAAFRSVAEDTRGLSWEERRGRLEQGGNLLDKDVVKARQQLTHDPTHQQQILASEEEEQRQRDARTREMPFFRRMASRIVAHVPGLGQAAGAAAGEGGAMAAGAGAVATALPYVAAAGAVAAIGKELITLPWKIEQFAAATVEAQRDLRFFNATINSAFAQLDYLERQLAYKKAQEISGTTAAAAESYGQLKQSLAPIENALTTIQNLMAASMAQAASTVVDAFVNDPINRAILNAIHNIERRMPSFGKTPAGTYIDFLGDLGNAGKKEPKNLKPREEAPKRAKPWFPTPATPLKDLL